MRERQNVETWYARCVDPDKPAIPMLDSEGKPILGQRGKHKGLPRTMPAETEFNLTALGKTTDESRRAWAIDKATSIQERKAALASGVVTLTQTPVKTALEGYYKAFEAELKPSTLTVYRQATEPFEAWANNAGLTCAEILTPAKLLDFRAWFVARPAFVQAGGKGIGKGKRKESKRKRSPGQINKCLRALRTVLNYLRRKGQTPALTSDNIRENLEFVKRHKPLPRFLEAPDVRKLLKAALRHDAEKFELTRDEKAGDAEPGTTAKHVAIAPFIAAALFTGCRFTELANLRWEQVKLDAGEIRLDSSDTKTGHGRKVDLTPTPALAALLAAMKLRAKGCKFVFGCDEAMRRDIAESARKRLRNHFGAPRFSWHDLRRTCGTFLTCAPNIYGAASAFLAAKRLGHSVSVSERHYLGQVRVSPKARTLERAMLVRKTCAKIVARANGEKPVTPALRKVA
jgi:integrase